MKYSKALTFAMLCLFMQQAYAQRPAKDSLTMVYDKLLASSADSDKELLSAMMYTLLESKVEKDWQKARVYFYQLKKIKTADSIVSAAMIRFPEGQINRDEKVQAVYDEKDPVKKEKLLLNWMKQFPPEKYGTETIVYDYARNSVSTAYAEVGNIEKAVFYANQISTLAWKSEGWAGPAYILLKNGNEDQALKLFLKALGHSRKFRNEWKDKPGATFAGLGFRGYATYVGNIYLTKKDYVNAIKYFKEAHDSSGSDIRSTINSPYAKALMQLKRNREAFDLLDEGVKAGQTDAEMKEMLKQLYATVKGSNAGYDEYMANVSKILAEKVRKELARKILNQPAPDFILKDVDGNVVSLASLKGKIVLIDFWATWCGPCKRSFPSMKTAQDKFAGRDDVKFLFIHTWEKEDNATAKAKEYVVKNNLPFQVLMDLKNKEGVNEVIEKYNVSAIPTKFVIDKQGNIRFKFTGTSGSDEAAVEEVTAMIEMAEAKGK